MTKCLSIFATLLLAACAGRAQVAPQLDGKPEVAVQEDAELIRRLEELDARGAKIADLTADFEQRKHTPLLKKPLTSTGTLSLKGSVVRWNTAQPEPSVMRIDERELRLYYPKQAVVEVYPIAADMRRMTASPLPRLEAIRSDFFITALNVKDIDPAATDEKSIGLMLTPKSAALKAHVKSVKVLIDVASACATQVEMTDPDGERTVIVFSRIRTNTGLKDSDLALGTPSGLKVVHPLEGAPAAVPRDSTDEGRKP